MRTGSSPALSRLIKSSKTQLPLVVSPAPCVYRKRATEALDRVRRPWRVAYTCSSLAGSLAAVRAGLGMTVLPKEMVPPDLHILDGKPLRIISCEMHPARIPAEYWRHRIRMAPVA